MRPNRQKRFAALGVALAATVVTWGFAQEGAAQEAPRRNVKFVRQCSSAYTHPRSGEPAVQEPAGRVGVAPVAEDPDPCAVATACHVVVARHVVTIPPARFDALRAVLELETGRVAGLRGFEQPERPQEALTRATRDLSRGER